MKRNLGINKEIIVTREEVLDHVEEQIALADGSLLSVVADPFRTPTFYYVVYLAPTEKKEFEHLDHIRSDTPIGYHELDEWMSRFIRASPNTIWPIADKSIVDVLYRDTQFEQLAVQAQKCITARFFDPEHYLYNPVKRTLIWARQGLCSKEDVLTAMKSYLLSVAVAIHFMRTKDLETDYNVLRGHFKIDDTNLLDYTIDSTGDEWSIEVSDKIGEMMLELQGAKAVTKIQWDSDLEELLLLGKLAMGLRKCSN